MTSAPIPVLHIPHTKSTTPTTIPKPAITSTSQKPPSRPHRATRVTDETTPSARAKAQAQREADATLARERMRSRNVLQSTWENIFHKYSKSFDGIADEIDPMTGVIVVDNGHLRSLADESETEDAFGWGELLSGTKRKREDEEAEVVDESVARVTGSSLKRKKAKLIGNVGNAKIQVEEEGREGGCGGCRLKDELDHTPCQQCKPERLNSKKPKISPLRLPRDLGGRETALPRPQSVVDIPHPEAPLPSDDYIRKKLGPQGRAVVQDLSISRPKPGTAAAAPVISAPLQSSPLTRQPFDLISSPTPLITAPSPLVREPPLLPPTTASCSSPGRQPLALSEPAGSSLFSGPAYTPTNSAVARFKRKRRPVVHIIPDEEVDELASATFSLSTPTRKVSPKSKAKALIDSPPSTNKGKAKARVVIDLLSEDELSTPGPVSKPRKIKTREIKTLKQHNAKGTDAEKSMDKENQQNIWAPPPPQDNPFYNPMWDDEHPDGTPKKFPDPPVVAISSTPAAPPPLQSATKSSRANVCPPGKKTTKTPRRKKEQPALVWTSPDEKWSWAGPTLLDFLEGMIEDEEGPKVKGDEDVYRPSNPHHVSIITSAKRL